MNGAIGGEDVETLSTRHDSKLVLCPCLHPTTHLEKLLWPKTENLCDHGEKQKVEAAVVPWCLNNSAL